MRLRAIEIREIAVNGASPEKAGGGGSIPCLAKNDGALMMRLVGKLPMRGRLRLAIPPLLSRADRAGSVRDLAPDDQVSRVETRLKEVDKPNISLVH
jgi:hypothetical protein